MKNNIKKFFKTYGLLLWLILAILATASLVTYASYMRTQNLKRVISTLGGAGNRFSSNRLDELETDISAPKFRLIPVPETVTEDGIDRPLTICNYPQGVEASFYDLSIYYNIEVELTDNQSNPCVFTNEEAELAKYYIVDDKGITHYFAKDADSGKYLLTIGEDELKGRKANYKTYTIHFPNVDTGVYMKFFVRPTVSNGGSKIKPDDLKSLGAMISAVSVSTSQDTNWSGALVEPRTSGKTVSDYDAFNYVISGSGAGTITVKWKADMLEINPYYLENEGIMETVTGPDSDGYMTLAFDVSAEQTKNRYSFQMYKKAGSNWSDVGGFSAIANDDNSDNPLIVFDFTTLSQNSGE